MSEKPPRRGVMTLRTLGRGFWIGLAGSIALHAALLSTGSFRIPVTIQARPIEARLENKTPKAVMPPQPVSIDKSAKATPSPASIPAPPPVETALDESPPSQAQVDPPLPEIAAPSAPLAEGVSPPGNPPATGNSPKPEPGPHLALTQAAANLKELPRHIEIRYELRGMISGRQTHVWHHENQRYTLEATSEATGLAGIFLGGKMTQRSAGHIGELGLMPERYEMQRLSGKKEILIFNYEANTIEASRIDDRKGRRTTELPLPTGTQDPLSSIYQLAMAAQTSGEGLIVAAGAKRVKGYPYRSFGVEAISTPLGEIRALHVSREGESGKGAVHLWLSVNQHHLPVRIIYTDDDGAEWVLEAADIRLSLR